VNVQLPTDWKNGAQGIYRGAEGVYLIMTNFQLIGIAVTVVVLAIVLVVLARVQKSRRLRTRFGPEYQRAVQESGSASRGEDRLAKLEQRVERFNIHPLPFADRSRFAESWRRVQANFVDAPEIALAEGDQLVREVMTARGYPVVDFEQQAADLSVNHPLVVERYRAGHAIALRHAEGKASTEDLRQAMIHYRKLFDDLIGEPEAAHARTATA
jgi:hypothetical protein